MTTGCSLCGSSLTPVLDETALWQVWLNVNQNLLGKLVIVLKRHEEQVARLSAAEWLELHAQVQRTTERLRSAFAPDHFNYGFLQNQDRHVHLHVIPRYAASREVSGIVFDDPDYPDHYAVPGRERRVSPAVLDALATLLQGTQ
jgi:diadenosine tetraphosphate (Ap4A) HIT family hydrolase